MEGIVAHWKHTKSENGCYHLKTGAFPQRQDRAGCYAHGMNHHDGIEPYKFSLSLRNDVIEIVLLYRRQDGCTYCVTELVGLFPLRQLGE